MYADPQSVTINAVATSLPRVGSASPTRLGKFQSATGDVIFEIKQDQSKDRFRREVRLSQRKIALDPVSAVNKEVSTSVYLVVDEPKIGFTDIEIAYLTNALVAWFTAANRDKLLGGEL